MKAALIKLFLSIAADEKARKKLWLILFSVIAGLLGMMCLPFIVLCCMHESIRLISGFVSRLTIKSCSANARSVRFIA